MPRKVNSHNSRKTKNVPKTRGRNGNQYILSSRAGTVLQVVLDNIIAEALQDAKRIAEQAGKRRLSLCEVEEALKRLCSRYYRRSTLFPKDVSKNNRKSK